MSPRFLVLLASAALLALTHCAEGSDDGGERGSDLAIDSGVDIPESENADAGEDAPELADVPATCDDATAARTSVGCSFYVTPPLQFWPTTSGTICQIVYVTNPHQDWVTLQLELGGETLSLDGRAAYVNTDTYGRIAEMTAQGLPPGGAATLFLSGTRCGQSVIPAKPLLPLIPESGRGRAFHLESSRPVAMHSLMIDLEGSSAFVNGIFAGGSLLLPTTSWGTEYVVATGFAPDPIGDAGARGVPTMAVVATEDGTEVTLTANVDVLGADAGSEGMPGAKAGVSAHYHLDRGEVIQLGQPQELTGSWLTSNKPVGVWGGHTYLMIAADNQLSGDPSNVQLTPLTGLGHRYTIVRHPPRFPDSWPWSDSPPVRLVGVVDDTRLSYLPHAPAGAPTSLSAGEVREFVTDDAFLVESQDSAHPFYAAQHMANFVGTYMGAGSGSLRAGCVGPDGEWPWNCAGDAEHVDVVPVNQFRRTHAFTVDYHSLESAMTVIRSRNAADVYTDCRQAPLEGWRPIGQEHEYTYVTLVTNRQPVDGCKGARHIVSSDAPIHVTVWGWDIAMSYAYSATR